MGTIANVLLLGNEDSQSGGVWFCKSCDGMPANVLEELTPLLIWTQQGRIRADASQSAGWLVLIGRQLYQNLGGSLQFDFPFSPNIVPYEPPARDSWKVGYYEPCPGLCEYANFLYIIKLHKLTIDVYSVCGEERTLISNCELEDTNLTIKEK